MYVDHDALEERAEQAPSVRWGEHGPDALEVGEGARDPRGLHDLDLERVEVALGFTVLGLEGAELLALALESRLEHVAIDFDP